MATAVKKTILVTGGAGFIGSALIRHLIAETDFAVVNVDCLSYAGSLDSLREVAGSPRYHFERVDVRNGYALARVFAAHRPDGVVHLAAETHVDRSIDGPTAFIETNVIGTYSMLEAARNYWERMPSDMKRGFRFLHVSTDEVFGSLGEDGAFVETSRYDPRSPYSASKAAADHLVRAWHHTYGLPVVISNCSNNYGPYQFPEKLIPLMVVNAITGKPLPVYGTGKQVRDWLSVEDHARALARVFTHGAAGESYNIGGNSERCNLEVVHSICDLLEELSAKPKGIASYRDLIAHVPDRLGHDARYAMDTGKIEKELGWRPQETFESGLRKTVQWYLDNREWWRRRLARAGGDNRTRSGLRLAAG